MCYPLKVVITLITACLYATDCFNSETNGLASTLFTKDTATAATSAEQMKDPINCCICVNNPHNVAKFLELSQGPMKATNY